MEVQDVEAKTHLQPGIQSRGRQNVDPTRHVSLRGCTTPWHWFQLDRAFEKVA